MLQSEGVAEDRDGEDGELPKPIRPPAKYQKQGPRTSETAEELMKEVDNNCLKRVGEHFDLLIIVLFRKRCIYCFCFPDCPLQCSLERKSLNFSTESHCSPYSNFLFVKACS